MTCAVFERWLLIDDGVDEGLEVVVLDDGDEGGVAGSELSESSNEIVAILRALLVTIPDRLK